MPQEKARVFLNFLKKFLLTYYCFFRVVIFGRHRGDLAFYRGSFEGKQSDGKGSIPVSRCLSAARDLDGCCDNFVLPFADLFEVKFGGGVFQYF